MPAWQAYPRRGGQSSHPTEVCPVEVGIEWLTGEDSLRRGAPRRRGAVATDAAVGHEYGSGLRPKRMQILTRSTDAPEGATFLCVDEPGPGKPARLSTHPRFPPSSRFCPRNGREAASGEILGQSWHAFMWAAAQPAAKPAAVAAAGR
jgi:hypothetical protein